MSTHNVQTTVASTSISRDGALALIAAARSAAGNIGIEVAIAVTDAGGHLAAFERSEHSAFLTADVAIDKAWTAASFGLGTHVWNTIVRDPKVAQLAHRPRVVTVGGGVPIRRNGQLVGGIGISGGTADQDQHAAEVALRALGFDAAE
jgi:uncharacterized protein GlcG (DUF336 family)